MTEVEELSPLLVMVILGATGKQAEPALRTGQQGACLLPSVSAPASSFLLPAYVPALTSLRDGILG